MQEMGVSGNDEDDWLDMHSKACDSLVAAVMDGIDESDEVHVYQTEYQSIALTLRMPLDDRP